jgi:hypothetical protein
MTPPIKTKTRRPIVFLPLENEYGEYFQEQAEDLEKRLTAKPGYEIVKVFCLAQWFYVHWRKDSDPVDGEWDGKFNAWNPDKPRKRDTFETEDENGDPVREISFPFRFVFAPGDNYLVKLKIPKRLLKIADVNLED